jgi:DNA-binding transcriptional LysR family regulator
VELRHLRYFAAVVAHGSFHRAAARLHLTQPAISRQVKDLEDELAVRLFVRAKNAVTLTDAGKLFYEDARELLARSDQAIRRVRAESQNEILRVGYAQSMTSGIMSGVLKKFQCASPHVRVELADLSSREMNAKAREGLLDLLVTAYAPAHEMPGFQWTELWRVSTVLVMAKSHPLAKLKKIAPTRLRDLPLIGLAQENYPDYVRTVRAMLEPFGVTPRFQELINDGVPTMFPVLEANRGVAILAEGVANIMPRTLVARPFSPGLSEVSVKVGVPTFRTSPHAAMFARLLRQEAKCARASGA